MARGPHVFPRSARRVLFSLALAGGTVFAAASGTARPVQKDETFDHAICRLIDDAAVKEGLPNAFFTRLIWRESSFRPHVVSHAGAQGIAQFMPATARARGLENPFDPASAIPASAALLADHLKDFGNLGLAAAAYNAGPGRVTRFLAGGGLPLETRDYVRFITGRSAEQWAALKRREVVTLATPEDLGAAPDKAKPTAPQAKPAGTKHNAPPATSAPTATSGAAAPASSPGSPAPHAGMDPALPPGAARVDSPAPQADAIPPVPPARPSPRPDTPPRAADPTGAGLFPAEPCLVTLASLRKGIPAPDGEVNPLFAPWGVQVSGNFSRATALASYRRLAAQHRAVFGELTPVIVATRMAGRGRRVFYRVRLPAETRGEANAICNRLRKAGGACIVMPN